MTDATARAREIRQKVYIDACHPDYAHQRPPEYVVPCPVCQAIERGIAAALQAREGELDEAVDRAAGLAITCQAFQLERDALRARVRVLTEALEFYADPATYRAIAFLPDPPCGEFAEDFDDPGDQNFPGERPGKLARAALAGEGTT